MKRPPTARSFAFGAAVLSIAVTAAGCAAPGVNHSPTGPNGKPVACSPAGMTLVGKGKLTIATDRLALEPWFVADDPTSGEGFESGIGYQIAVALGFDPHNVVWRRESFARITAPGPKDFDLALDEVTIRPERRKNVDFSVPYFDVTQAVVVKESGKLAEVTDLAGLRDARLGAMAGTTSFAAITGVIKPRVKPTAYPSLSAAIAAVNAGTLDAVVTDLPTAFYIAQTSRLVDGMVLGQLHATEGAEQVAAVLPKGSSNTTCVNDAIARIAAHGILDQLRERWIVYKGAPVLKGD